MKWPASFFSCGTNCSSWPAMGGKLPGPASGTAPANAYTTESNPIVVIGEQYIAPYPVDLKIQHTVFTVAENNFDITDVNDNPIFKVKNKLFSFPDRRVLLDAAGNPLVSLKQKVKVWFPFSWTICEFKFSEYKFGVLWLDIECS
ncbi:hypothetical protein ES332_D10G141000v1 [Gossypium tomentosum]|uniref:Uncharacterized protein n=1 Tax=Gossypium tomentosum TaxID=34277 RepID=A0A5D2J3D1_GOSTO|nr:hypothetical protein ES332_D10G141000v1 [Gossypium tomentosum]